LFVKFKLWKTTGVPFTFKAFVNILVAVCTRVPLRAATGVGPVEDARVTNGCSVARVGGAGIVEVTVKPCSTRWTLAVEAGDFIMANSAMKAGLGRAVVNVVLTIGTLKAVHTNARITAKETFHLISRLFNTIFSLFLLCSF
jgi:hypothetical protein